MPIYKHNKHNIKNEPSFICNRVYKTLCIILLNNILFN